ncbi:MAG: hypothetical protein KKF44_01415 [Nanoarchaeota archaeon]|nr:hypothetical protein [Nanoarchaeota archaeon]
MAEFVLSEAVDFVEYLIKEQGEFLLEYQSWLAGLEKRRIDDLALIEDLDTLDKKILDRSVDRYTATTSLEKISQDGIIAKIKERYHKHGFVGEEGFDGNIPENKYVWYIDPVCGSGAYGRGDTNFAVNIALTEDGNTVLGAVYLPALKSHNLFIETHKTHSVPTTWRSEDIADEEIRFNFPIEQYGGKDLVNTLGPKKIAFADSANGSIAHSMVQAANGVYGVFVAVTDREEGFYPWDMKGAELIVKAYGGKVRYESDGRVLIASCKEKLADDAHRLLEQNGLYDLIK